MADEQSTAAPTGEEAQKTDAASQQSAAGASDEGKTKTETSEKTYSEAEMNKAIGRRQAAREAVRQKDAEIAKLKEQMEAVPSKEELEAFQAWAADRAAQERDAAIKKGDVDKIEAGVRGPLEAKVKGLEAKLEARNAQLAALLKDQALNRAASELNAINPTQVVGLLRDRVQMQDQDGSYVADFLNEDGQPLYDGDGKRVTTAEGFVRLFLKDPANANLIKANVQPGSGAKSTGSATGQQGKSLANLTKAEFEALPPDERRRLALESTPEQRRAMEGIEPSDKKGFL